MNSKDVLGLDIGVKSVGWSLVRQDHDGAGAIVATGVRVFPDALNLTEAGKGTPPNEERRMARQRRRQLFRRAMRRRSVRHILQEFRMLPPGDPTHNDPAWRPLLDTAVYALRAKALDHALPPEELGRVFYHLAHRRGFLSGRKTPVRKDEKQTEMKEAVAAMERDMAAAGTRTLGEFLARQDSTTQRLRGRRTLRGWYKAEFDAIWQRQQPFHPQMLTPALRERLEKALFFQRPLRIQKHLLGFCEIEGGRRRAPMALLDAQRFRLLQDVNHTCVIAEDGATRDLTTDQRTRLIQMLETAELVTFGQARKALGLRGTDFNLEEGGRKGFTGNRTAARIREAVGEAWDRADRETQDRLVNDLLSFQDASVCAQRAIHRLGVDAVAAEAFSEVELEDAHARLSSRAIQNLLPHLEAGLSYAEAVQKAYPDLAMDAMVDQIPPIPDPRNPLVRRSLTEVRRVVNAIVRKHGKPDMIRVELARDLKQNEERRIETWKAMRRREEERTSAAQDILKETGVPQPRGWQIERVILAQECGWKCPYTGTQISMRTLLDENSPFDVEHIIPFSRCLDDSFSNKTLCEAAYNRSFKGNRTPWEAAGSTSEWDEILDRVRQFKGPHAGAKLRRFMAKEVLDEAQFFEGFSARDLAATGYASRLAAGMLGRLFPPDERRRRIQVTAGRTTAYLRSAWRLNGLLGGGTTKSRDDHRHHALDAAVIALTSPATTHALTRAVIRGRAGAFDELREPWPAFKTHLSTALDQIVVSHRVDRRVTGCLHNETFYGMIPDPSEPGHMRAVVRKPITRLSEPEIRGGLIVDPAVRQAVLAKLAELRAPPEKAFQDRANHPFLTTADGRRIPIHRVRVFQKEQPTAIGGKGRVRNVSLKNNHHAEIFEITDRHGEKRWRVKVVPLLEVMQRLRAGLPAVSLSDTDGSPLVFSLAIGDTVSIEQGGQEVIAIVQKLSMSDYVFRHHREARLARDARPAQVRLKSDDALRKIKCRKLSVDPIGQVHDSRD